MSKEQSDIIRVTKSNILFSVLSVSFFLIALGSMVLILHPFFSNTIVWIFIILFYGSLITSTLIAMRTIDSSFRILKVTKSFYNFFALIVSVIVIVSMIVLIINVFV
jgi:hypothetical protein